MHSEQQWLDFSPRERWVFFSSDIQDHLDSASGWNIGYEATGLCKMGKNLSLPKPRVTFPLTPVGPRLPTIFWIDANGICIVQIGAGKGGNYLVWLCLSVTWMISPCCVGRKAKEGVKAEVWEWSPLSKVGRIHRHIVFCTVSTVPEIREPFRLEKTFEIIESNHKPNTAHSTSKACS